MTASPENTIAVVVGVERYMIDGWSLDGPALDACRFANWLHGKGVPKQNITLLLSTLEVNQAEVDRLSAGFGVRGADRDAVHRALAQGINSTSGDRPTSDLLIVYWGGHGVIEGGDARRLLYADATADEKRNLNITTLLETLRSGRYVGHPHQLVIVDACLNYAEDLGWTTTTMPDERLTGGRPNQVRDQYALFAASPGEAAVNLDAQKTGLFSQAIREVLAEVTDDAWPPDANALRQAVEDRFAVVGAQTPSYLVHAPRPGSEIVLRDARRRPGRPGVVAGQRLLTWAEFIALKQILRGAAKTKAVRAIYRDATRNVVNLPPPSRPEDLLSALTALRSAVDPVPLFTFLVLLAASSDQDTQNRLWAWLWEVAPNYDVDMHELEALDHELQRKVFLLRVEPDCLADERFQVTVWEFNGGTGTQADVNADPWDRARLAEALSELIKDVDPQLDSTMPVVEFLLPTDLLDEDLESLPVRLAGTTRAIGATCPVVVRSLRRLETPEWHQSWRECWNAVIETGDAYDESAICFVECVPDVDATRREVCTVLAYERAAEFRDDDPVLTAALGGGTAVMVWHRPTRAARRDLLANVLRGWGLRELPDVVHGQRSAASGVGAPADHAGKDLVLLWDDPDRVPLELRYGPPKGAA